MLLGVNIDHIATIRNSRGGINPSPIEGAKICMKLGVNGITAHLREDRRHIKDDDIFALKKLGVRLNMEMAATKEMQEIALKVLPNACCIVPEKRQEITTEGGLDVFSMQNKIKEFVKPLVDAGILVSLFIAPEKNQIDAAFSSGVQYVELHTGTYSNVFATEQENVEFEKLKFAAEYAHKIGLKVNAGHGLDYDNVKRICSIKELEELNIGHSIISKAIFVGLENAVIQMMDLIK